MLPSALLEAALAVAVALVSPAGRPQAPVAPGDGVHVLAPAGERHESWYLLEVPETGADGRQRPRVVGLACLRRSGAPGGPVRLEAEFRHPQVSSRVLMVEEPGAAGRRLVYRELIAGAGRSVIVEELAEGGYSLLEWGGTQKRSGMPGWTGAIALPLELAEAARTRRVEQAPFEVFDPLAGHPVRVRARIESLEEGPEPLFEIRYERDDGTLAASYRVRSEEIVEFSLQRGGPRARLVTAAEASAVERHLRSQSPP